MNPRSIRRLVAAIMLLATTPFASAATGDCAAMDADGPRWFAAQLDAVQKTYQAGNSREAYEQLWNAMMRVPRRADVSLDARCVGPELWRRTYQLRRAITATLGKQSENVGRLGGSQGALDWYVLGDNRDEARRVITKLTPTADGTGWIIGRLQSELGTLDYELQSGFELLPEEREAQAFWQRGLDGTIGHARRQGQKLLAQEEKILSRDATAKELELEDAQESTRSLVAQFYGDEALAEKNEAQRDINRAKVSLRVLEDAQDWFGAVADADAEPARTRALTRGDALMARAADSSEGLEARDALYEAADAYFDFARDRDRRLGVERGRAAIAPALVAERNQRSAEIQRRQAAMQEKARQSEQAMRKTEAEKKRFKEEADALEAELDL